MEYINQQNNCFPNMFHVFVCLSLTLLLAPHFYGYFWPQDTLEEDFSSVKYVLMQLTHGLSEINQKHERLQSDMERISSALPAVASAAGRAREAISPTTLRAPNSQALDNADYDQRIPDFALESNGARILDTVDTVDYMLYESPVNWALHVLTSLVCRECKGARMMLNPGNHPGECWAFKGSKGEALIRLAGTIHVTGLTLEHIPPHISLTKEISSAPRRVQLEGLESQYDAHPFNFGTFEYDKTGKPIQYFKVSHSSPRGYHLVKFRVLSNWGHPVYTCVYRVRIHGDLVSGQVPWITSDDDVLRIEDEGCYC